MKRNVTIFCVLVGVIVCFFLFSTATNHDEVVPMRQTFDISDFDSIEIGTSTYRDVYSIAPPDKLTVTSYGSMCEYSAKDGGKIRIEFLGEEMTVCAIKLLSVMD